MNPPQHSPFTSIVEYMTRTVHFRHSYYTVSLIHDNVGHSMWMIIILLIILMIYRKYRFSFETTPSVKRENHPAVKTSKTEKIKTSRI